MRSIRRAVLLFACAIGIIVASAGTAVASPAVRAHAAPPAADSGLRTPDSRLQTLDDAEIPWRRSVVRVGQEYALRSGEVVRDVHTFFGNVTLEGRSEGDVVVVSGNVTVKNTAAVNGSLVVVAGSATIERGASLGEDVVVIGGTLTAPSDFAPGGQHVVVATPGLANLVNSVLPWVTRGLLWGRLIVPGLAWVWVLVGITFLVYLAINTLFDRPVAACADQVADKPLTAFLVGLLVLVLSVPAIVILAATVIGLAVVPFVLCAMVAGALFGKAGVARAIGRNLVAQSAPDSRLQSFRSFLLGSAAIVLAYMVPVLGLVTWALTAVVGIGSAAIMVRAAVRREHPRRERVPAPPVPVRLPPAAQPATASVQEEAAEAADRPLAGAPPSRPAPAGGDLGLYPRATFLDRVVAFALDCLLVGIATAVFDFRHDGSFPLLLFAYHLAFWAWKGTTLGGIVVGLRVIRTQGDEVRFADALVRVLAGILSLAALGIGCLWMLNDPERQMWHDKIAGTFVVRVPRELVLA